MKILLARPKVPANSIGLHNFMICDPIELTTVAAGLDPQHEVRVFDGILDKPGDLAKHVKEWEPDVVGFTSYINGIDIVSNYADQVKAIDPNILTVVGGVHATRNQVDYIKHQSFDTLVRGEGVLTFNKLVNAYADSGRDALTDVQGVHLRMDPENFSQTTTPAYPHPDQVPLARRELVKHHWDRYYYLYHDPCHLMKTAWGCPYTCSFCYCWQATEGHYSFRSPEAFVAELEQMWSSGVYIVDDDFFLHPKRMMKIHDLIVEKGIKKTYFAYGRADFIAKHPDIVKAWSKIGLQAVVIGVESADDEDLDYFDKGNDSSVYAECFKVLREANVDPYASFILNPNWDLGHFRRLQQYIYKHKLYYVILQPLMPLPGTTIWDQWKDHVVIDRDHHEMWDISHLALPSKLPMDTYFREMVKLYIRTCLDLRRLPDVNLRTLASPFHRKVPQVLLGGLKICWQLWNARKRYRPNELERYELGRNAVKIGKMMMNQDGEDLSDTNYHLIRERIAVAEGAGGGVAPTLEELASKGASSTCGATLEV